MSKAKQKRAKRLGFHGKLKTTDKQKSVASGRLGTTDSSVRHVKDHRKPEDIRRQRLEDLQEKQKTSREQELMRRRNLHSFQNDILHRQRAFEQKEADMQSLEKHVNFENENSRKVYYREFKKVVEASDVVLEVLDARDPLGCRCPQVEQAVIQSGTNKKIVLVLNKIVGMGDYLAAIKETTLFWFQTRGREQPFPHRKTLTMRDCGAPYILSLEYITSVIKPPDLVSKEIVEKWIKYLRNEFPTVAFKASTQLQNRNLKRSAVPVTQATAELLSSSACVGAECLMKLLGNYCRNLDIKTAITVGVVGFPNVGKSSLINSLKRARACSVGATPGVTKCLQEVHLDKHIKLLDCPGIVMATSTTDAAMILRNCVKIEQLVDPLPPVEAILRRCNKAQIMEHYGVADFHTALEFLALLARRQGKLRKGGLPDSEKAAKGVLMDWTGGKISYFTHPPETHTLPTHISAEIVKEMGKAFNWEELEKGNQEVLDDSSCPDVQMGFCMETAGMTQGGQDVQPGALDVDRGAVFKNEPESMEDDQDPEFGPMTVQIKSQKPKSSVPSEAADKAVDLKDIFKVDPLQQGQALLAASKKRKKQQKRADKIATQLSDNLTAAMDFSFSDS